MNTQWISVDSQLPPDDMDVLLFDGYTYRLGSCHRYTIPKPIVEWSDASDDDWEPTHWMPLPPKPIVNQSNDHIPLTSLPTKDL